MSRVKREPPAYELNPPGCEPREAKTRLAATQLAPGTKRWTASPSTLIAAIAKKIDVKNAVAIT
jgi:hypothetical protein